MDAPIPGKIFFLKVTYMFSIMGTVLSVENELILLNLFEWRAASVLFLQTFNPKSENNVRPMDVRPICPQTVRTLENMQKI